MNTLYILYTCTHSHLLWPLILGKKNRRIKVIRFNAYIYIYIYILREKKGVSERRGGCNPGREGRIVVVVIVYLGDFLFVNSLVDPVLNTICVVGDFIPRKNEKIKTAFCSIYISIIFYSCRWLCNRVEYEISKCFKPQYKRSANHVIHVRCTLRYKRDPYCWVLIFIYQK